MIGEIILWVFNFILGVVSKIGYWGIFLLMVLDNANIPIPSEVTMPFSGFLASRGDFGFLGAVIAGTIGSLIGSWISYLIALWLKNPLEKFLKKFSWLNKEYERAERFFKKHGELSVFWGRFIPVVRTFISFPAGIFRVKFLKFSVLTLGGSFIWSFTFALAGYLLGENWIVIEHYFKKFDYLIVGVIIVSMGIYIGRRLLTKYNK